MKNNRKLKFSVLVSKTMCENVKKLRKMCVVQVIKKVIKALLVVMITNIIINVSFIIIHYTIFDIEGNTKVTILNITLIYGYSKLRLNDILFKLIGTESLFFM